MRKQKTIHYIYKTTCNVTKRYYIGMHSTNDLDDGYMGSGRRLRASIRKHGEDNHSKEILEFFDTRELLIEAEVEAITEDMITDKNCMNLMGGGSGGFISNEHYDRIKKLASEYQKKMWKNEEHVKNFMDAALEGVKNGHKNGNYKYDNFKDKTHSEETKKKMSESSKGVGSGKANSQYGTCWITKEGDNKKIKKEDLNSFIEGGWVRGRK